MHLGDVIYNFRMAHNKMSLMEFAKLANTKRRINHALR
nr:MAG TPA: hypothetical protein [Caudoviricetes sp.]